MNKFFLFALFLGLTISLQAQDGPPDARCIESLTVELDEDGNTALTHTDLNDGSTDTETPAAELVLSFDPAEGPLGCSAVGTQTVSLIVTDNAGQADTCFTQVTVEDNIPPTITCQSVTLELDPVAGAISLSLIIDGALLAQDDNCALRGPEITGPPTYDCTHLGENNETITMVDVNGNESTCDIVVTIIDPADVCAGDTPPLARCFEALTVQIDADGELVLAPADLNNGSSDVETAPEDLLLTIDFGEITLDCDDIGQPAQPVELIVTDNIGQTDTCVTQVTVEDNTDPAVICQDVVFELRSNRRYVLVLDDILNSILTEYTDNCGELNTAAVVIFGGTNFSCGAIGEVAKSFTFENDNGEESECDVTLAITDPLGVCGEAPVAICQPFTVTDATEPTATLNANVFDDGSTDDRSVYALVYSDETDRQENTTFDCSTTGINQGQTFTAGQTGVIQSIKVRAGAASSNRLLIRGFFFPGDTVSFGGYFQDVDLFFGEHSDRANLTVINLDVPFPVTAGQEYFFRFVGETTLSRSCPGSDAYTDGRPTQGFNFFSGSGDEDLTFEVNIIGPDAAEFPAVGQTPVTVFAVDDQGNVSEGCETVVNPDQALPVSWLSFGAHAGAKAVELQWETTEEPDNAGFHVERSATGNDWSAIGEVAANVGPSQGYAFTDAAPLQGSSYYRLRQTDFDGELTYSPVETVEFYAGNQVTLYPNPATDIISVQLPEGAELLGLLNVAGQAIDVRFSGQQGELKADISGLPTGLYFLRVSLGNGQSVARRLLVH